MVAIHRPAAVADVRTSRRCAAALAPDLQIVATGDEKGIIRIWSTATGKELRELAAHSGEAKALAFSADGSLLVSGGEFYDVHLWNTQDWTKCTISNTHDGSIECLAIDHHKQRIATGGRDGWLRIWDLATSTKVGEFQFPSAGDSPTAAEAVHFSPDDTQIIAAANDGIRVFDRELKSAAHIVDTTGSIEMIALAVAETMDRVVCAGYGNSTLFANWRDGVCTALPSMNDLSAVGITADGRQAAVGGFQGRVSLYHHRGTNVWTDASWYGHSGQVNECLMSADGRRLLTCSPDGTAKLWDVSQPPDNFQIRMALPRDPRGLRSAVLSPDGSQLAVSNPHKGEGFGIFDLASGTEMRLGATKHLLSDPIYSDDGQAVFAVYPERGIWKCVLSDPLKTRMIDILGTIHFQQGSPGIAYVALRAAKLGNWEVAEWDIANNTRLRTIYSSTTAVSQIIYRPRDGVLLICRGTAEPVLICNVRSTDPPRVLAPGKCAYFVAVSPTDNIAVFVHQNVTLFEIDSGEVIAMIPFRSEAYQYVAFSPDGSRLAISRSATDPRDSHVEIWNVQSQQTLLRLATPDSRLRMPSWSRDGRRLAVERDCSKPGFDSGGIVWTFGPRGIPLLNSPPSSQ